MGNDHWGEGYNAGWEDGKASQADTIATLQSRLAAAEAERDEAQREHTDMMWQRRRADERAEAAEAQLAAAEAERNRMLSLLCQAATHIPEGYHLLGEVTEFLDSVEAREAALKPAGDAGEDTHE